MFVQQWSLLLYSQLPENGNNLNVLQQMEGNALKLVHIHSGVLYSCKEKEILEFVGKWRELEKIIFSEVT